MMGARHLTVTVLMLALAAPLAAQDEDRSGVEIRAIEEQPRALHLVSWRSPPSPGDEAPSAEDSRVTRLLEPLDDRRFLAHLGFRQTLRLKLNKNDD